MLLLAIRNHCKGIDHDTSTRWKRMDAIVVHCDLKKKLERGVGFRNPLKASFFLLNRKFGGTFVKIPVGI